MGYVRDRWRDPARKGKGKRWQVKYQVDGKERDGGSFDNKEIAKNHLKTLEADLLRGAWVDPSNTTTVLEACRAHVAARPVGDATRRRLESQIRNHVEATFLGERRLASVRPSEAQAWITDRSKVLKPKTVRNLATLLRSVYTAAMADRLVASSPFVRLAMPRDEDERVIPLTVAQVLALADAMAKSQKRYRALVLTQAGLGLRIGELLALRVQDVNFLGRSVRVQDQIARNTGGQRAAPKTPLSRRTIPLPDMVSKALAAHIAEFPPAPDGLLFHTASGRPYSHAAYGTLVFGRAVTRAKLPEDTVPHDLRHHYASVLLAAGESVIAVAERLGHKDASLVLKTYGHLLPDSEDRTRRAVDDAWQTVPARPKVAATAR